MTRTDPWDGGSRRWWWGGGEESPGSTGASHVTRLAIPDWYHCGMSKQIAVRLPEDLVEFVDRAIDSGAERSRAAFVARALERERRRLIAAHDAAILAGTGSDPDLQRLAEHATGLRHDLD